MVYQGKIKNGVVVLDGPTQLPEGTAVRVEPVANGRLEAGPETEDDPIFRMSELAVETGIPDLATNLDHYLYGHPKVTDGQ